MSVVKVASKSIAADARRCAAAGLNLSEARHLFDMIHCAQAVAAAGGNRSQAARDLGIDRTWLHKILNGRMPGLDGEGDLAGHPSWKEPT